MKLPKSLIHSILVGITAGTMACSFDVVTVTCDDQACEHGISCPANAENRSNGDNRPFNCPACGLG